MRVYIQQRRRLTLEDMFSVKKPYIVSALLDHGTIVDDVDIVRLVKDVEGVRDQNTGTMSKRPCEKTII